MLVAAFFFWLLGFALFWRLPSIGAVSENERTVSVVIPARDEEANIGRLLESLSCQTPPAYQVITVDDHSSDATAERARAAGATVVAGEDPPDGWMGKPWACWQGATRATGELLLFLDADTWLEPGALGRLAGCFGQRPGLLSVQPYHQMASAYERLGALFNLITMIGTGAFTVLGWRLKPRTAFGPCVMVARKDYMVVGGHQRAAGALVEGPALGQAFADAGYPVRCAAGRGAISFRMYPNGAKAMVDGHARSFATGAWATPAWLLMAVVAWIVGAITTTRHLLVGLLGAGDVPVLAIGLALLYAGQLRWMLDRLGNFGWWPALVFPIPVVYFVGVFSLSLFRTWIRPRVSWKGRSVLTK